MTVGQLKKQLSDFPDDKELQVSEHGQTMRPLYGILEGKTNDLLILVGDGIKFRES